MTNALAARGQGVIAAQQYIEDLGAMAYAIYKAQQAQDDLNWPRPPVIRPRPAPTATR